MGQFRRQSLTQSWLIVTLGAIRYMASGSDDLVAPGALRPYDGAPPVPRKRGTVRRPAAGFFIAGSSIQDLNGVYTRVHTVRLHRCSKICRVLDS